MVDSVETVKTLPYFIFQSWTCCSGCGKPSCPQPHVFVLNFIAIQRSPWFHPASPYSSSKISQCATTLHRGAVWHPGIPRACLSLEKHKKPVKKRNQSYYVLSNQQQILKVTRHLWQLCMEASQERPLEVFTCKLTIWIRPGLCVISLNTHILTADDTFLPQNHSREKAQVVSAHSFTALLAFTPPNLSEVKTIWIVSTEILHHVALSAKLSYHQIWGQPWWNPTSSATFLSVPTQMKSKYHAVFTNNVTYPHLHVLEDKIFSSADSPLEG